MGQEIKKVVDKHYLPGHYAVVVNSDDLATGVYFYQMSVSGWTQMRKMVVVR